jgi:hypothetical protein
LTHYPKKTWEEQESDWWKVPVMKREFIQVTGITKSLPNTAVAEYVRKWVPTANGKALGIEPSKPLSTSIGLQLLDDGWRVAQ